MSTFDWPDEMVTSSFSLTLRRNTRGFVSPYNGTTQTLELGGDRWVIELTLPPSSRHSAISARREALMDKLAGGVNSVRMWHRFNPIAGGTFKDAPVAWPITDGGSPWPVTDGGLSWPITDGTLHLPYAVEAGANTCVLQSRPGRTVEGGGMVSINGQLVRIQDDATADGAGEIEISFEPRSRADWPAYSSPIVTSYATGTFKMLGNEAATPWSPGLVNSTSLQLVEDINI